ncbi:MAG: hypothetical protein KF691_07845 [Phycisphaeraceae bacterium]|nr:hypothetical protein [Phycisphaeraceae bacterium]
MSYFILDLNSREIHGLQIADVWAEIAPFSLADLGRAPHQNEVLALNGGARRLVIPAGELEGVESGDAIERAFRSWGGDGKEVLDSGLRSAVEQCNQRGIELIVWPRLHSIVSDIPGLLRVARAHENVGIFLEPAALFPANAGFRIDDFAARLTEVAEMQSIRAVCVGSDPVAGYEESQVEAWIPLLHVARKLEKPIVLRGEKPEMLASALNSR